MVRARWFPPTTCSFDDGGFYAGNRALGVNTVWAAAESCSDCNGLTTNSFRYDLPTFAGFSVSASWGEDDFWDVAARYAGEFNGFKVAAATAYSELTDGALVLCLGGSPSNPCGDHGPGYRQPVLPGRCLCRARAHRSVRTVLTAIRKKGSANQQACCHQGTQTILFH